MNNIDIEKIYLEQIEILKNYGLDKDSILEFQKKIKKVSDEEKKELGEQLFNLISKKNYNQEIDFDKTMELIYNGADVNYKEQEKGNYSLLICSNKNYLKTFVILLKAGANINQTNNYMTTATMSCARHGRNEMLKILMLMGADINLRYLDGDSALISAIRHSQLDCLDMLIEANANINIKNISNQTIIDIGKDLKKYDLSKLFQYLPSNNTNEKVTEDDTKSLLDEAEIRMKKIIK